MKIEKRAIANVTNFRDTCKRAAEQMGWDLKDTSYAVWDFTLAALEKQLNPDYVEVVRCKDCIHHDDCICVVCEDGEMVVCGKEHRHVPKDHYCSRGVRK